MGGFAVGTVVLVPFPFSDLSEFRLRPAVVLADAGRGDLVLCQVTSNRFSDARAVEITQADFAEGSLPRASYARPGKLFTANAALAVRRVGVLASSSTDRLVDAVVRLLRPSSLN